MNNRINASNWNQGLHQAAHENQKSFIISFSEQHPISNLTESLAYPYHRVETSASADLRNPRTTSGKVQLSGEHNSAALAQGHLGPREPKQKLVPVPPECRRDNEDEHTRISPNALKKRKRSRKLVLIPPEFRHNNEDEHTRISLDALYKRKRIRKLVPVPPEFRRGNEDEHTRISPNALVLRRINWELVPVPMEHRRYNEGDHTLIRVSNLALRKRKKLKSAALSGEKPHAPHQTGETSAANTLADSNSARQNSPILTRSPSGSNALPLHETAPQGAMENDESFLQFESDASFFHWLDDVNAQQGAIDYMLGCHWQNGTL